MYHAMICNYSTLIYDKDGIACSMRHIVTMEHQYPVTLSQSAAFSYARATWKADKVRARNAKTTMETVARNGSKYAPYVVSSR
jgi:hypothetical protein